MPKLRRKGVPAELAQHLLQRIEERDIQQHQLGYLLEWVKTEPTVPEGKWYKRFSGMIVCGEGEFIKTFLHTGQVPFGEEVF